MQHELQGSGATMETTKEQKKIEAMVKRGKNYKKCGINKCLLHFNLTAQHFSETCHKMLYQRVVFFLYFTKIAGL